MDAPSLACCAGSQHIVLITPPVHRHDQPSSFVCFGRQAAAGTTSPRALWNGLGVIPLFPTPCHGGARDEPSWVHPVTLLRASRRGWDAARLSFGHRPTSMSVANTALLPKFTCSAWFWAALLLGNSSVGYLPHATTTDLPIGFSLVVFLCSTTDINGEEVVSISNDVFPFPKTRHSGLSHNLLLFFRFFCVSHWLNACATLCSKWPTLLSS